MVGGDGALEEAGVLGRLCVRAPAPRQRGDVATIERHTHALADALDVRGLLNVQYAVKDGHVFVIEANPRASRTVPFVSKATGVPLAKAAARVMAGATLAELRAEGLLCPPADAGHVAVKEAVLPFDRFPTVDTVLGPEMRSTGEVMGVDRSFGLAFAKSQAGAGNPLPAAGTVFLSRADRYKPAGMLVPAASPSSGSPRRELRSGGDSGAKVASVVAKVGDASGAQADAVGSSRRAKVDLVINAPSRAARRRHIRHTGASQIAVHHDGGGRARRRPASPARLFAPIVRSLQVPRRPPAHLEVDVKRTRHSRATHA